MKEKLTGSDSTERRSFNDDDDMDYNDQGAGWRTVSEHTTTTATTGLPITTPGIATGTTTGAPIMGASHTNQPHESTWDRTKDKAHEMKLDAQEKMEHLKNKVTGRDDYTARSDNW